MQDLLEAKKLGYNYIIYSDGSSLRGDECWIGGIGVAVVCVHTGCIMYENSEGQQHCTNSRAELLAALDGLRYCRENLEVWNNSFLVISDSMYVVNSINDWIDKWKDRSFCKYYPKDKEYRKLINNDVIERIYDLSREMDFDAKWVKGHSKHEWNTYVDDLASTASASELEKTKNSQCLKK